ncbi:hypothetical protein COOONC_13396 [Cooperia oncophora]
MIEICCRDADLCDGNQTWSMAMLNRSVVSDFKISADIDAQGKLFFFVGAPYKELVWFSGSNQEQAFTLPVDRPIFVVLWYKGNSSALKNRRGFSVAYSTRESEYNSSPHYRRRLAPALRRKHIIVIFGLLLHSVIFISC